MILSGRKHHDYHLGTYMILSHPEDNSGLLFHMFPSDPSTLFIKKDNKDICKMWSTVYNE